MERFVFCLQAGLFLCCRYVTDVGGDGKECCVANRRRFWLDEKVEGISLSFRCNTLIDIYTYIACKMDETTCHIDAKPLCLVLNSLVLEECFHWIYSQWSTLLCVQWKCMLIFAITAMAHSARNAVILGFNQSNICREKCR